MNYKNVKTKKEHCLTFLLGQNVQQFAVSGAPHWDFWTNGQQSAGSVRGILLWDSLTCFVVLYRETGGPHRGGRRGSRALFSERFRVVVWGFPGCLVPGIPFAFLVLSPLWQFFFFFFLMCLLGWLETKIEVGWRMIELGQFSSSFCWEVSTFMDTANPFAS